MPDVEELIFLYRNMDAVQQRTFFDAVKTEFTSRRVLLLQPQNGGNHVDTHIDGCSSCHIRQCCTG